MEYGILAITDDVMAEDAINDVRTEQAERDRLLACCDAEIEKYEQKKIAINAEYEKKTNWIVVMLGEYCRQKAVKATKTTQTYKLPSGTLKWLKKDAKPIRDDSKLLSWIKTVAPSFVRVKTTESPAWDELKKTLIECGDHYEYMIPDGELVPVEGVTLEPQEDVFTING